MLDPGSENSRLDLIAGLRRHRVGARGAGEQAFFALSVIAFQPGLDALARDPHRRSDGGLLPARLVALNDQAATMDGQAGTSVGHENLRVGVGLRQATSHSEVLVRSTRLAATN